MDNKLTVPSFEDGGIWNNQFNEDAWRNYRVGTCTGLYRCTETNYEILCIYNETPGNRHVEAMLAHFYASCKRDKRNLIIKEVFNKHLSDKLLSMGFTFKSKTDLIKRF